MDEFEEAFQERIAELSPVLSTKAQLMSYFQKEYGSHWNQELSARLQKYLPLGKNGKPQTINNIMRRHQERNGRITATTAVTAAQYAALGEEIGPVSPPYGYSVTWRGEIQISGTCAYREFTDLLVAGNSAKELAENRDIAVVFKTYFQGLDLADGWCGVPEIEIEEAGEFQEQMIFEHGPQGSKFASIFIGGGE